MPRNRVRTVVLTMGALVASLSAPPALAQVTDVTRIAGSNRYKTMAKAVEQGFAKSEWAVVASGEGFADALSASALAGARRCPVVLTSPASLSAEARAQLKRLGVKNAYVVGGTGSVSEAVVRSLSSMGIATERISGKDRVGTSLAALSAARSAGSTSDTIVLASGDTYADALAIGPWAWATASPIVLCRGAKLSGAAVSAIRKDTHLERIVVVGGESSVSEGVRTKLGSSTDWVRLGGPDRYATAAAVADWAADQGLAWECPIVATGRTFPDALAGAALAGAEGSPLLLADDAHVSAAYSELAFKGVDSITVLGGESSVAASVVSALTSPKAPSESSKASKIVAYSLRGTVRVHSEYVDPQQRDVDVVSITLDSPVTYRWEYRGTPSTDQAREVLLTASIYDDYGAWAGYDGDHVVVSCTEMRGAYHDASYFKVDAIAGDPMLILVD